MARPVAGAIEYNLDRCIGERSLDARKLPTNKLYAIVFLQLLIKILDISGGIYSNGRKGYSKLAALGYICQAQDSELRRCQPS